MQAKKSTVTIISIVLVICAILLLSYFAMSDSPTDSNNTEANAIVFQTVSAASFADEISMDGTVILDIRTPQEFELGRIENSINIDYYSSDFQAKLDELDKIVEYKIYCNSGNRSASAMPIMKDLGFTNVVELSGGIQAWTAQGNDICTNC